MNKRHQPKFSALVIDDEADIRELLEITLQRMGGRTLAVADVKSAIQSLDSGHFDLCLTDMRLPDGRGMDVLHHIYRHCPELPVAVITAYGNVEDAVESLKAGAFDFISKPVDVGTLQALVDKAIRLPRELPRQAQTDDDLPRLIGSSASIEELRKLIGKLARSQAPVYISGESGTGKELVARQIHRMSPRAEQAFVPVNCGAIPPDLMESELFGHVKGSFTGAIGDKPGLFQAADGGTLFLDEVAELPLHMQVKLLRAIQERRVRRVGAQAEEPVDVRILCATHKALAELVESGEFRKDLYYRINVIQVHVPALRERAQDIPLLCEDILQRLSHGRNSTLDNEAIETLKRYPFPGNVRELENILERALALADGDSIGAGELQLPSAHSIQPGEPSAATGLQEEIAHKERQMIREALEKTRYNKTRAAELLGLSFRQFRYRLKKLGID